MSLDLILEIKSLTLTVGFKTLFRNRAFSFPQKGLVLIMGQNGAGKSTLLREIYLNSRENSDWIWYGGKKEISYLGHELGLYSSLTLSENLEYYRSLSTSAMSTSEIENLIKFYQLSRRQNEPIFTFSRGMKQKAGIIRTFSQGLPIVLLDEPYTGLDVRSISLLTDHLNREKKNRLIMTVLHETPKDLLVDGVVILGEG